MTGEMRRSTLDSGWQQGRLPARRSGSVSARGWVAIGDRASHRGYAQVRADPRRFVLIQGHEVPGEETLVDSGSGWVVVDRGNVASAVAEAIDPRG
jgi:hypothetical protein